MRTVLAAAFLVAVMSQAQAGPAPKPWARGVPESEQAIALEIYSRGNAEFEEARYAQALAQYRQAIKHWDHPAIRFNMAVCLINLDQPVEAYAALTLALQYGWSALGGPAYAQGLEYRKQLTAQLATLEVRLTERRATLTLDGETVLTRPGDVRRVLLPGRHQLVATKPGYLTSTVPLTLVAGEVTDVDVALTRLEDAPLVRRWATWKPWLVVGSGVVLGLAGGYFELRSHDNFQRYDDRFAATCPTGCGGPGQPSIPAALTSLRDRATLQNRAAITLFVAGGLALVTGAIGVYINQPRVGGEHQRSLALVPQPGGAAAVLDGTF